MREILALNVSKDSKSKVIHMMEGDICEAWKQDLNSLNALKEFVVKKLASE